ncbi:MAG: amino acid adenylation domain-containing protein, partial [Acidobacteriota bacterium]
LLLRVDPTEHVLVVTMHHIVSDGWSVGIFLRELGSLYAAFREGRPSPLPALPVQYPDFAVWQRSWLTGSVLSRLLDHWRERLAGAPELLELPTDRPRPPVQSQRGDQLSFRVPADRSRRLNELARGEGATLFMALLAVFDALLHRVTGVGDVVVGSPVAGRVRPEIEDLIGFFVNTLPLRTTVSGTDGFRRLLGRVRGTSLDAFEHEEVPFEKLVEELRPARDPSHGPIFQVLLALQNAPAGRQELPGLEMAPVPVASRTAKFDLTLVFVERPDGVLAGGLEYNRDLFDRTTMLRFLEHLQRLVAEAVQWPDRPIGDLALLSPAERQQLVEWNASARPAAGVPIGGEPTIDGLVAAQAARTPDAVAVVAGPRAVTFAELERRANALARHLATLGAAPERPVGIAAERSVEMVVGLLAILRAGGAYVPLDPSYPAARLRWMVEDSGARVLLAQRGLEDLVAGVLAGRPGPSPGETADGTPVVWLGDPVPEAADPPADPPASAGGPDRLAYVIYTSGSTGRPKGAMNAHRGVVNRLLWMIGRFGTGPDERFFQKTPFGFDVSVWELFTPLICGARLEMARPGGHREPAYLAATLAERGVTTAHSVPSMLGELLEVPEIGRCSGTLRRLVASGEELTPELAARFFERLGRDAGASPELHNFYGPTEAAIEVSHWRCPPSEDGRAPATVPIGRPVAGTTLQVVDPGLRPVPVGVAGELLIGGVQVARGYRGLPALTAERFVPDPAPHLTGDAAREPAGARVYRTGDLVRRRPDGVIEFLGRIDHQVKIRGFRIELGEIESVLGEQPGVRRAVVLALRASETSDDRRLVACVLPETGPEGEAGPASTGRGAPEAGALRAALVERLPESMVPSGFVTLDELPLLASGKVDRRTLAGLAREQGWRPGAGAAGHVPPRTPVEVLLAEIWEELLEIGRDGAEPEGRERRVGVHDDFFTLGGHSLLVTRLVARLRERLGVDLPVRTLFEAPTLGALAAVVEASPRLEEPPVRPVSRRRDLPLSFAQERLWFLDRMEPGRSWYNLPAAVRLSGELDVPALARSLGEIVRRHEALRTVFRETGESTPVQVVRPGSPEREDRLPVVDLSGLEAHHREAGIRRVALAEALRPFDLARGPLLRSLLLRAGSGEHVLVATMHHIASDGWSVGIFLQELAALYAAFRAARPAPLPELPVQYPDFAVWQRTWLSGKVLARRLEHWRERLAGAPELLELPTDRPRPPVQSQRGGQVAFGLDPEATRRLRTLARGEGATLFMALLATFDALLHRLTGADDLVVGSPVAGRVRPEVEPLIGFFV